MNSANTRLLFLTLVAIFIVLGFGYAITTPIFEASDELWHYPFVRHLAEGNPLPVQDPNARGLEVDGVLDRAGVGLQRRGVLPL